MKSICNLTSVASRGCSQTAGLAVYIHRRRFGNIRCAAWWSGEILIALWECRTQHGLPDFVWRQFTTTNEICFSEAQYRVWSRRANVVWLDSPIFPKKVKRLRDAAWTPLTSQDLRTWTETLESRQNNQWVSDVVRSQSLSRFCQNTFIIALLLLWTFFNWKEWSVWHFVPKAIYKLVVKKACDVKPAVRQTHLRRFVATCCSCLHVDVQPKHETSVIICFPSCCFKPTWLSIFCGTQKANFSKQKKLFQKLLYSLNWQHKYYSPWTLAIFVLSFIKCTALTLLFCCLLLWSCFESVFCKALYN